jgi:ADP-heptose:LPS heptosyltransferase
MGPSSFFEKKFKKIFWRLADRFLPSETRTIPAGIRSVLVLRPDRLGNMVLSMPALEALQEKLGYSGRLTLVAGERNADLARFYFPNARVWVFRKNIFSRVSLWLRLWFNPFDAVIDFHSFPFSTTTTLLAILSGSPIRIGFWANRDFQEYEDISKRVFKDGMKAPDENLPEFQKGFLLVKKLFPGAKPVFLKAERRSFPRKPVEEVRKFYAQVGITAQDKVLGIHPTLQKHDNRWSRKQYLELIWDLGSIKGLKIIILHGKGENDELKEFRKQSDRFSNVFTLPSDDLIYMLEAAKRFSGLVCNDSGIMHLCALVTKIFAIFGPSDSRRWGPQNRPGVKHQVFQAKDGLCDSVKPREVFLAVKKELS